MQRLLAVLIVLVLSACSDPYAEYVCNDDSQYAITLTRNKAIAVLEGEGLNSELMRVRTSTGLRYRGSSQELWIDDDQLVLTITGVSRNCRRE
jgi:hypothetical protein